MRQLRHEKQYNETETKSNGDRKRHQRKRQE